mmetsp:Transcript_23427/g.54551  ORF Transcript_23427/g.54551 Transcript_23427/m.54551 type:complete len:379 (+) Transcript_23427:132-1268(+)
MEESAAVTATVAAAAASAPQGESKPAVDSGSAAAAAASSPSKDAPKEATASVAMPKAPAESAAAAKGTKRPPPAATGGDSSKGDQKRRKADFQIGDSGVFYTTVSPGATNSARRDLVHMLEAEMRRQPEAASNGGDASASASLDAELKALKEKPPLLEACLQEVAKGTGFIKFVGDASQSKPSTAVMQLLEKQRADFLSKKQAMTSRHVCRIIPIDHTCKPFPEEFKKLATTVLTPVVGPDAEPTVWALEFRARNTSTLKKETVLSIIDEIVPKGKHKVSLTDPEKCILVEVNPLFCGMSVLSKWAALRKYNLQALTTPEDAKAAPPAKANNAKKASTPKAPAPAGVVAEPVAAQAKEEETKAEPEVKAAPMEETSTA